MYLIRIFDLQITSRTITKWMKIVGRNYFTSVFQNRQFYVQPYVPGDISRRTYLLRTVERNLR